MRTVQEIIVVEGRYDKHRVSSAVNATILTTSGFSILNNKEKISMLRKLADSKGLIILTDGDRAGFFIRNRLKSLLTGTTIKHAFIPDISGSERRKSVPSKEGKLGVEAMTVNIIIKALEQAGATFLDSVNERLIDNDITKFDLYEAGLTGGDDSAVKRRELLKKLELPERLSTNGLLEVLNILYTRDEFCDLVI